MNKKLGQRVHAKRRAFERFGIALNRDDLKDLIHMVQKNLGIFVRKISGSKTAWALNYKNKKFYVAYDKNTKNIATVMPLEFAVFDLLVDASKELRIWVDYNSLMNVSERNLDDVERNINLAAELLNERLKG